MALTDELSHILPQEATEVAAQIVEKTQPTERLITTNATFWHFLERSHEKFGAPPTQYGKPDWHYGDDGSIIINVRIQFDEHGITLPEDQKMNPSEILEMKGDHPNALIVRGVAPRQEVTHITNPNPPLADMFTDGLAEEGLTLEGMGLTQEGDRAGSVSTIVVETVALSERPSMYFSLAVLYEEPVIVRDDIGIRRQVIPLAGKVIVTPTSGGFANETSIVPVYEYDVLWAHALQEQIPLFAELSVGEIIALYYAHDILKGGNITPIDH